MTEPKEVREFPAQETRVESGPIQFGKDWPGLFIRGDHAAHFALHLKKMLDADNSEPLQRAVLIGLLENLASTIIGPHAAELRDTLKVGLVAPVATAHAGPLPKSPREMPWEFHNNAREIRNLLVSLERFSCVDIHYEHDWPASNDAGDTIGTWEVLIEPAGRGRVKARVDADDLVSALWYCYTIASAADASAYEARVERRKAALAKLTIEERAVLGLRGE